MHPSQRFWSKIVCSEDCEQGEGSIRMFLTADLRQKILTLDYFYSCVPYFESKASDTLHMLALPHCVHLLIHSFTYLLKISLSAWLNACCYIWLVATVTLPVNEFFQWEFFQKRTVARAYQVWKKTLRLPLLAL